MGAQHVALRQRIRQELGYVGPGSLDDHRWFVSNPDGALQLIATELQGDQHPALQDLLVRKLCLYQKPYDAADLARLYDCTPYAPLRYAIANTLAHTKACNISAWLDKRLGEDEPETATEPLLLAGQRHLPRERARTHAERHLSALPGHAAGVLRVVGDAGSLRLLRQTEPSVAGMHKWVRTAYAKAIARLATKFPEASPGDEAEPTQTPQ